MVIQLESYSASTRAPNASAGHDSLQILHACRGPTDVGQLQSLRKVLQAGSHMSVRQDLNIGVELWYNSIDLGNLTMIDPSPQFLPAGKKRNTIEP